jgi:Skp family chaperone for outer membrane proteins
MFIRRFALAIAVLALSGAAAAAQQEKCPGGFENVQRVVAISRPKETQIKVLLEQVARACREHNEVVALAGIDQVRAILQAERKSG